MKKVVLLLMMTLIGMTGYAQDNAQAGTLKFGYLSYEAVFQAMPEYAAMQANMEQLRSQYEAEMKRVEDDFNKKYEEFLDGQSGYPQTILQKRQAELQELLDRNIAFKKESQRLLDKAKAEAEAPLKARLYEVLAKVASERGFAFVLNTDVNAVPWLNVAMGENITDTVKDALQQ